MFLSLIDDSPYLPVKDIGDKYVYNGKFVPRVNDIISAMLHEDSLMGWSNYLGLVKKQKYAEYMENVANIGTCVHSMIEHFLSGVDRNQAAQVAAQTDNLNIPSEAYVGFDSFLMWWDTVTKNNSVEILATEKSLVCPYFGGTMDALMKIGGKIYLVDFKTSNHSSYKQFIQLSAYRYMLKTVEGVQVDGDIILRLNKNNNSVFFEELLIQEEDTVGHNFMNSCEETFMALTYSYYCRHNVELKYKELFSDYT